MDINRKASAVFITCFIFNEYANRIVPGQYEPATSAKCTLGFRRSKHPRSGEKHTETVDLGADRPTNY